MVIQLVPLIIGICIAMISMTLALYLNLRNSPGDPPRETQSIIQRFLVSLCVSAVLGLMTGSLIHGIMFKLANLPPWTNDFIVRVK
jgi:uncharacterized membrane protein